MQIAPEGIDFKVVSSQKLSPMGLEDVRAMIEKFASEADEGPSRPVVVPKTHATVLIVDDEPDVLELMVEILQTQGYETVAVTSPTDALRKARLQKFDAAVIDILMPEMTGLLLHAKLKILDRDLSEKTVFVSGHFTNEELRRHLEGSPRFLQKPFSIDDLARIVGSVIPPRLSASRQDA